MRKKKNSFFTKTVLLFGAAAALLVMSTVGSTRAALIYNDGNAYRIQIAASYIGVGLKENGEVVSYRSYDRDNNAVSDAVPLLSDIGAEVEKNGFMPGRAYTENLSVTNPGEIDSYVRVIVYKSWKEAPAEGRAAGTYSDTTLSPELIQLDGEDGMNGWVKDAKASGNGQEDENGIYRERLVLYYTKPLASGEESPLFNSTLAVDPKVMKEFSQTVTPTKDGNVITTSYTYDGYSFNLEVEADAVQTHNAQDAIKSAWGVDVDIAADGTLSLRQ